MTIETAGRPATSAEATAMGLHRFFTGRPCRRGHATERYVHSQTCVECAKIANRRRRNR